MTMLATVREPSGLTDDQIQLIKDTIAKEATDDELRQFIAVCNRLGLDPFAKQIYLVRRFDKSLRRMVAQAQVAIDGFRVVAERTGQYRGQTKPEWCGWDGVWRDVWLSNEPPAAARVGVWREGNKEPLYRTANYTSYLQTTKEGQPAAMWRTMPEVMLLKCAEAQALRTAFPNQLGSVYTPDEMGQANNDAPPYVEAPPARPQFAPVVPIHAEPELAPGERQTVAAMFGTKLRANRTQAELVAWMREVIKAEFDKPIRETLWKMFRLHCQGLGGGKLGFDPNFLAKQAQTVEVTHG